MKLIVMMGSKKNYEILNKKFKYQIKIGGAKLVKKIFNSKWELEI